MVTAMEQTARTGADANSAPVNVLLVEDSEHDIRAIERCWSKGAGKAALHVVRDGRECLDYLSQRGKHSDPATSPPADLVLLDSNPLAEIGNTRKINAVVVGGRLITRPDLDKMLADVASLVSKGE